MQFTSPLKRQRPPSQVTDLLAHGQPVGAPKDRLLAWAALASPGLGFVAATDRALYLADGRRLGWEAIDTASFDRDTDTLLVIPTAALGTRLETVRLVLAELGPIVDVVRERVTATVVFSRHVALVGKRGVVVIARRPPGTDELKWTVVLDRGVDPSDPGVKAQIDAAVAELRAETGL